eukprot:COSAG01_NODE_256_length_20138_cov_24.233694_14_plen_52_part_00
MLVRSPAGVWTVCVRGGGGVFHSLFSLRSPVCVRNEPGALTALAPPCGEDC